MEFSITATDINQNIPLSQIKIGDQTRQKTISQQNQGQNTIEAAIPDPIVKDSYSLEKPNAKKSEDDEDSTL
jgi:hypothetical protein